MSLADYAGLKILDISTIPAIIKVGTYDSPGKSYDVSIK